ncbi:glycoside hydrolase [Microthyrium microscopicum]|uniref:alpha-L-fucosidase n=1 Tax=Microthyrium microscopicum TaxID=703497 RepID=A0A6A6UNC8_9PEZI|nr:glycoside hydrolase [Microthyrium microscopicum]
MDRAILRVESARATESWPEGLNNKTRIIQVVVTNIGQKTVIRSQKVRVTVRAEGIGMLKGYGYINRLLPGDQATVDVGVVFPDITDVQKNLQAHIYFSGEGIGGTEYNFNMSRLLSEYRPDFPSIYRHGSPSWFNDAKFGIFIHWGPYAVPGWGNSGKKESYAEWYWWNMQDPTAKDETMAYHKRTYGENVVYDDFISNFTVKNYNPVDWVNLFNESGAKYFVLTAKHHDGYSLYDLPANVSKRTSVAMTPHRNLVKELFDAAAKHQPKMKRGVYFSLPEWFHPDYKKYGFGNWPGGNATNTYTKKSLPYAGYVPVKDYLSDVVGPSMQTLANMGTDIMWCDIGGPNVTLEFASNWYNKANSEGRQVVMNNRCGFPGDYDTPEYARLKSVQRRKWETNLGMDPYSYGFNSATKDSDYMNATSIVRLLVDIVSKNGNLLLDIGPKADGTIIEIMKLHLTNVGKWLSEHGEAIYGTKPWFVASEEGANVRFTTTSEAFYIHHLDKPPRDLRIKSSIPWIQGDNVTVVGGRKNGTVVPSVRISTGEVVIMIPPDVIEADRYTWVFKIPY